MATDVERLVVRLEATQNKFEKQMAAAARSADRNARKMENRFQRMNRNISKQFKNVAGGFSKGFIGAIAGVATVQGIRRFNGAVQSAVSELSAIAKQADKVGVTTDALQELRVAADLAGVGSKGLDDALQRFSRRVGEAATGTGVLHKILLQNNIAIKDTAGRMRPVIDIFEDYADLINRTESEQEKLALAFKAFDKEGAGLVNLFKGGSAALKDQREEIRKLGIVIDSGLIRRAEELEDKFALASKVMRVQFLELLVEMAPFVVEVAQALTAMVKGLNELRKSGSDNNGLSELVSDLSAARKELFSLNEQIAANKKLLPTLKTPGLSAGVASAIDDQTARRRDVAAEVLRLEGLVNVGKQSEQAAERFKEMQSVVDATNKRLKGLGGTGGGAGSAALAAANPKRGLLELIKLAEGTVGAKQSRGFNTTLGFGKFTGGPIVLVNKTLREILAIQTKMLAHPDNTFNSSAVGAFQITKRTLKGQIGDLGLDIDTTLFSPEIQTRIATNLAEQRGRDVEGLRKEWEGLKKVADETILSAFDNTSGFGQERAKQLGIAKEQKETIEGVISNLQQENDLLQAEGGLIGKNTAEREKAIAIAKIENELKREGIKLTPELRSQIEQLVAANANLAQSMEDNAIALDRQIEIMDEIRGTAKDVLGGFVDDLRQGESASIALSNALQRIADKLADIAVNNIIDSIFGASGTAAGGGVGGVIAGLFAFKDGGKVRQYASGGMISGPGTGRSDSVPVLASNGEFIVNARATRQNQKLLEAINNNQIPRFAAGGQVSGATTAEPVVNTRIVNAIDGPSFLSEALAQRSGERVLLNHVRARPQAFRQAMGI